MNATQQLHALGQSLWLDNITHELLASRTLDRYIEEYAVTGLTSNPTIFDHAIKDGEFYDEAIRRRSLADKSDEALFFELATEEENIYLLPRSLHWRISGTQGGAGSAFRDRAARAGNARRLHDRTGRH